MKNFIFDLYGTLADIGTDEWSDAFRNRFSDECAAFFGTADFWGEYARLLREAEETDPEREPDVCHIFRQIAQIGGVTFDGGGEQTAYIASRFRELSRHRLAVYPQVPEMLADLRRSGARLYILSNAQHCFTVPEIRSLGLDRTVDGIELSSDFGFKKPSPKFFCHILEKYGLRREESVYIGNDLAADIVGANRVGLTSVYIKTDISPETDSLVRAAELADAVAWDHEQLKKILLSFALSE